VFVDVIKITSQVIDMLIEHVKHFIKYQYRFICNHGRQRRMHILDKKSVVIGCKQ